MQLTNKAKENYDKFLQNYNSTLEETDPELAEILRNFIYDEVEENSLLPDRSKMLIILATLITNQSMKLYEIMLQAAINVGVKPVEIKEILYQTIPYAGLSKVYDFIDITNQVFDEIGIDVPLPGQSTTNHENRKQKGHEIQVDYFGEENISAMNENTPNGQKHINDFLEGFCFGDFYTRTGLTDQDRELITFAILLSLRGCENQLRGHTAANIAVGNDKQTLIYAVTTLMPYIGFPRTLNAFAIVNEICN
ncbi:carboxymuconolactone decarboxylase family protein [Methanosphaera sp.]